ncbi:hypothetical protein [Streptomyces sp. NBC_00347]|uniref:hypothetical protein n=1 Tax=Streptomyces sp. NBC_00347 TaxID=2975721 RepID=UPI00224D3C6E|nr:hypothetical protein [Streptomyces sp. NBC_00347]MCX5128961.1 hypothetical protein [Streptomyces sp. NBC_00347]
MLQQPDPDGLFQIVGVHPGAGGLGGRLGREQRAERFEQVGEISLLQVHAGRDAKAVPGGFPAGHGPLVREAPVRR